MDDLPLRLDDLESLARAAMDPRAFDYYLGGAEDEHTLAGNREALDRIRFRGRVLVDVTSIDLGVELLGTRLPSPVCIAPTAFQRLAHPGGEEATAAAAATVGHLMVASTLATTRFEEVAASGGPTWLQLYVFRDRGLSEALVQRAEAAGATALCLTVDTPVQGKRERDVRNGFALPPHLRMANFDGGVGDGLGVRPGDSALAAFIHEQFDPSVDWSDVAWLRSITRLPLVLKGVTHPEDARRAVDEGIDGLVVSNHGGRQLDGALATIDALPDVVAAVQGRIPVLLDGGVRRGRHVAAALCLGAAAVLVGRPVLYGLAAAGRDGVRHVLDTLDDELSRTMALLGATRVSELGPDLVAPRRGGW